MGDALSCLVLQLWQSLGLEFVVRILDYIVLGCLYDYRFNFVA